MPNSPITSVQFMSQHAACALKPMADTALISITGPASLAPIAKEWESLRLLRLEFHDEDSESFEGCLLFDRAMAQRVINFATSLPPTITRLYVHCYAGISRSAAVAKFCAELFDAPFPTQYSVYNKLVYSTLRSTYFGNTYDTNEDSYELPASAHQDSQSKTAKP